jgi:2-keto-4-pentenoate hydratase/2-oxohepta-3-ene-1,7-dioic acid hydratase in catechol pathway
MIWFALGTYGDPANAKAALVLGEKIYDMGRAYHAAHPHDERLPAWLSAGADGIIHEWTVVQGEVYALAETLSGLVAAGELEELSDGKNRLLAPLRRERIFGAAANYIEHANEMGTILAAKSERNPYFFMKADSSIIGPGQTIRLPKQSEMVDWEIELAAVIGRECRHVDPDAALEYVAGYSVINDISARDLNVRSDYPFKSDWFQGKCFDTFAPLGPWIVPASCIEDPQTLNLHLSVNEEVMQESSTAEMIYSVREQIAYLSTVLTLRPGDILATGTPTGVGMARGSFLRPGDVITASIEKIGTLRNPVAAET